MFWPICPISVPRRRRRQNNRCNPKETIHSLRIGLFPLFLNIPKFFWPTWAFPTLARVMALFFSPLPKGPFKIMHPKGKQNELHGRRLWAMNRLNQGDSLETVSKAIGVGVQSLKLWQKRYIESGEEGLSPKRHGGNPKTLTMGHWEGIQKDLLLTPIEFGIPRKQWDGPALVALLLLRWNLSFHPRYIYTWLRKNQLEGIHIRHKKHKS